MERFKKGHDWWQSASWLMLRQVPVSPCWHPGNNPTYQVPLGHRSKSNTSSVEHWIYCPAPNCRNQTQSWLTGTANHLICSPYIPLSPIHPSPLYHPHLLPGKQPAHLPFPHWPLFCTLIWYLWYNAPTVSASARAVPLSCSRQELGSSDFLP